MGCCLGSGIAMSGDDGDDNTIVEYQSLIASCGGNFMPCTAGAIQPTTVITSSLEISFAGLTNAKITEPDFLKAIKKSIAAVINCSPSEVLINKITILTTASARVLTETTASERGSANIEFSVHILGSEKKTTAAINAVKTMDKDAITALLVKDPVFDGSEVAAIPSGSISTEVAAADGIESGVSPTTMPTLAALLVSVTLMVGVNVNAI